MRSFLALLCLSAFALGNDATGPLSIGSSGTNSVNTVLTGTGALALSGSIPLRSNRQQVIITDTGTNGAYVRFVGAPSSAMTVTSGTYDLIVSPVSSGVYHPFTIGPGYTGAILIGSIGLTGTVNVSELIR